VIIDDLASLSSDEALEQVFVRINDARVCPENVLEFVNG